jgi:DNA modification methylase
MQRMASTVQGQVLSLDDKSHLKYHRYGERRDVLDPYCGCGTLNVEANMIGINSIGVEIVPLFAFVSKTKCDALHGKVT